MSKELEKEIWNNQSEDRQTYYDYLNKRDREMIKERVQAYRHNIGRMPPIKAVKKWKEGMVPDPTLLPRLIRKRKE